MNPFLQIVGNDMNLYNERRQPMARHPILAQYDDKSMTRNAFQLNSEKEGTLNRPGTVF